jgi:hypothetical protein
MANLFDTANIAETEPAQIRAGDLLQWKRTDLNTDYANSAYTLKYSSRLEGAGSTDFDIAATASGDDYLISVGKAVTAAYTVGTYHWQMLDSGTWKVVPNRDTATTDPRSHAKTMVEKIEALLEGRADADVASYSIAGRSLTKLSIDELMTWRDRYKTEYLRELRRERALNGQGSGAIVKVKF